ncbi:hypothetical protein TNCV_2131361 [Trichonephila clavipes]|nr:hypothetical protein TNCV_2131361 [Trichonephila clavipes]
MSITPEASDKISSSKLLQKLTFAHWGGRGHIRRIQICTAPGKHFRPALGGVAHKSIGENRPALPQSFELSLPAEEYGTFYKHQAGRYASDLRIGRRKCSSSRKLYCERKPQRGTRNWKPKLSGWTTSNSNKLRKNGFDVIRRNLSTSMQVVALPVGGLVSSVPRVCNVKATRYTHTIFKECRHKCDAN